jgi:hypothetical protein
VCVSECVCVCVCVCEVAAMAVVYKIVQIICLVFGNVTVPSSSFHCLSY